MWLNESLIRRPGTFMEKVNWVSFAFVLILKS